MKKIILLILIIPFFLTAKSYNVPVGTKENKIILNINNNSTKTINHLNINPVYNNTYIKVYDIKSAEYIEQNNSKEIELCFDITDEAKIDSTYSVNFQFYTLNNLIAEKQIDILVCAPDKFEILNNYPNPFNPVTTLSYRLPERSSVTIDIYNIAGQKIESLLDNTQDAGTHEIQWNATGKSSGIYFYRIKIDNEKGAQSMFKRMTLIK